MNWIILESSAIIPSLILLSYFRHRDVFPEPAKVVWVTFGLGIVIVLPVLFVAWPVEAALALVKPTHPVWFALGQAFLSAAVPEELFKFLVLYGFAAHRPEFDEPMDGIVYGATASLGFATLENVLYVSSSGLGTAIIRSITAVPCHASLGAIMGYHLGKAWYTPDLRKRHMWRALWVPILLHGLYDFPLLLQAVPPVPGGTWPGPILILLNLAALCLLILEIALAVRHTNELHNRQVRLAAAGGASAGTVRPPMPLAPSAWSCWVLIAGGAIAASLGGLVLISLALGAVLGQVAPADRAAVLFGGIIVGFLPLVLGVLAFAWGVSRLNKRSAALAAARAAFAFE